MMSSKIERLLKSMIVSTLLTVVPVLSAEAGTDIDWNELRQGSGAVVFLVNGFGGCDPCITGNLRDNLKSNSIAVYDLDWNDIHRRTQQNNFNLADAEFLEQMDSVIASIPDSRPIILIGHSFGGDSVLKVAQRTSRKIALLGVLDAVRSGGVRTRQNVGENVSYFYNRWTTNPSGFRIPGLSVGAGIPLNAGDSGVLNCSASSCDQEEQSFGYNANGSEIRDDCESWEVTCPGFNPIPVALGGSNGTKHRRITHGGDNAIYKDDLIQAQLLRKILQISTARDSSSTTSLAGGVAFHNQWSGKCLQTMGQDKNNGSAVNIWDCTNTSNQSWILSDRGELRNAWSGKCLQTMGQDRDNSSTVNIWDCTNTSNQFWEKTSSGELRNRWSGKCLQTMGQDRDNGSTVNIWDCTNTSNQSWR
jgi:Ricin-type beta-trefoil lectin domain